MGQIIITTPGSGSVNIPVGAVNLVIEMYAPGGGAAQPPVTNGRTCGGGGGGGYIKGMIASPDTSYDYVLGSPGSPNGTDADATDGGNVTVSKDTKYLRALGGKGGKATANGNAGGDGGSYEDGDLTNGVFTSYNGGAGADGGTSNGAGGGGAGSGGNGQSTTTATGGNGGTGNPDGKGGDAGTSNNSPGVIGADYGGGGGSGMGRNGISEAGGGGAIIFSWEESGVQNQLMNIISNA